MRKKVKQDPLSVAAEAATASLIWVRPERPHNERPALSREQIVQVALSLADAEGIDAISIRRIAAVLGVTAMALYWYIERKEDVLDLMIDAVYGEMVASLPESQDWRSQLQHIGVQRRAMMHRHPWFAALVGHHAVLGPNALKQTDAVLGIVSQLGLDITISMSLLEMFNAYIVGFVLREMGEAEAQRRTGLTEREWQQQVGPYVQAQIIDSGCYPHLARAIVATENRSPNETFLFGLSRLLEGMAAYADPSNANRERE